MPTQWRDRCSDKIVTAAEALTWGQAGLVPLWPFFFRLSLRTAYRR
jgi:hypothetical protein